MATSGVLARGYVSRWDGANRRFIPLIGDGYKYSESLTPDGRTGFWQIDETAFQLFAHGEQSSYFLPTGWPRAVPAIAARDLNNHIWLATNNGKLA
ncbi:MAG: hypothetical protein WB676_07820 [Bryobacteraceae bacterium]